MAGTYFTCFSKYFYFNSCQSFCRYIDDIFFTSNDSLEMIDRMLDKVNQFHSNIKLVRQIGKSTSFLDVSIENNNGVLATSVYHKEMSEPYILPFKSDHPRHIFKNIINAALMRAIRYSSTLSTFNTERRTIKLTLLYNGYHFSSSSNSCTFNLFILAIHQSISLVNFTNSSHLTVQSPTFCQ